MRLALELGAGDKKAASDVSRSSTLALLIMTKREISTEVRRARNASQKHVSSLANGIIVCMIMLAGA